MKHHTYIGVLLFILISLSFFVEGQKTFAASKVSTWTVPFGGRVLSTKIPTVTCPGAIASFGTAPVVLSSNLAGLGQTAISGMSNENALSKVNNMGTGIYRAIPLYFISGGQRKNPKVGDWVLGRQSLIPDIKTCQTTVLGGVPFPVVQTNNYGVSQKK